MKKPLFVYAWKNSGAWYLPRNTVWNVPKGDEIRGKLETRGPWSLPVSYTALVITMDGKVFGVRTMSYPKESGYHLEGFVSIGGKKYSGFTSSRMFVRDDNSLIDVAVIIIREFK